MSSVVAGGRIPRTGQVFASVKTPHLLWRQLKVVDIRIFLDATWRD